MKQQSATGRLLTWRVHQSEQLVSTSTDTEARYRAASNACGRAALKGSEFVLLTLLMLVSGLLLPGRTAADDLEEFDRQPFDQKEFKGFRDLLVAANYSLNMVTNQEAPRGTASKSIFGKLVDAEGKPVVGSRLLLSQAGNFGDHLFASNLGVTNANGEFQVRGRSEMRRLIFEVDGNYYQKDLLETAREATVSLPPFQKLKIDMRRRLTLHEDTLELIPLHFDHAAAIPLRPIPVKFIGESAVTVRVPAGYYELVGRVLGDPDFSNSWTRLTLRDVDVKKGQDQTVEISPPQGRKVRVSFQQTEGMLKNAATDMVTIRIEVGRRTPAGFRYSTYAETTTKAGEYFEFGPVPEGPALLHMRAVYPSNVAVQGRLENPTLLKYRFRISDADAKLTIPMILRPQDTIQEKVQAILDSEHPNPFSMSWSWNDVQVSNLSGLEDRDATIAELCRLLEDEETPDNWNYTIISSLGRIKPVSKPTLAALATSLTSARHGRWRTSMISAIGSMGVDAAVLLPAFEKLQAEENSDLSGSIVNAVGQIGASVGNDHKVVNRILIKALNDPRVYTRRRACGYLGSRKTEQAVEPLTRRMQNDPAAEVRAGAAWALWQTNQNSEETVATMIEILESSDLEGQKQAAYFLQFFDQRAGDALPALEKLAAFGKKPPFRDRNDSNRYQLARSARTAIKAIQKSARDQN